MIMLSDQPNSLQIKLKTGNLNKVDHIDINVDHIDINVHHNHKCGR